MAVNSRRFQLDWDHRHTCHTIHHTQCKQTIHVHNWDIYGIFCGCHVNPWNNQAIKSCCQQAKTVTLQKNSSCWHENTFIISRLFFSSWLLLYAPHCFWAGLSGYKENVNELFKGQEKSQPMLDSFIFIELIFLRWKSEVTCHEKKGCVEIWSIMDRIAPLSNLDLLLHFSPQQLPWIWENSFWFLLNPVWEPLVENHFPDHRESPTNRYGTGSVISNHRPKNRFFLGHPDFTWSY